MIETATAAGGASTTAQIVIALIGALSGALFGYLFAKSQSALEGRARRHALARQVRQELGHVARDPIPYDVNKVIYQDPIRLASIGLLIQSLSYRRDGKLLEALVHLDGALGAYNDLAVVAGFAQSTSSLPDTGHRQLYDSVGAKRALVVGDSDTVLGLLPGDRKKRPSLARRLARRGDNTHG